MRRKKIGLLGGISLLALLALLVVSREKHADDKITVSYTVKVMDLPLAENLDFLEGRRRVTAETNPGVCFEGAQLPYSTADQTLYVAQNVGLEEWTGRFSTDRKGAFLCALPDEEWTRKRESIRDGHAFTIFLVEDDIYYEMSLVVSGMPVIAIDTEREEEQDLGEYEDDPDLFIYGEDTLYYGTIRVFDPGTDERGYEITESYVRYHLRGAISAGFEKDSYSFSLQDYRERNMDLPLLGMRSDNSWKLKSLLQDENRIREKTACQLWEQFALANTEINESGPRMEYAELVVDGDYKGLYGLIEPVDEEKLQMDANDVLYKLTYSVIPSDSDFQYSVERGWRVANYIRILYPEWVEDYEKAWHPVRDYVNTFYHAEGETPGMEKKIYLSNALDFLFFNMTVSGSDNTFKNSYFAADVRGDGSYAVRQIPWDLDLTFGNISTGFEPDITAVYEEKTVPFLKAVKPEAVSPALEERWRAYRETFLSTESICGLLQANRNYLADSGVVSRENARWPDYRMSMDIQELLDYQDARMAWLDGYFAEF